MNWDAHRYSALIATNCWNSLKSAKELGWNHKDDSRVVNTPFCRGVWDGAVYPDEQEVWKDCSKKLGDFYITPECPPPPPYHHRPVAVTYAEYYFTLARKSWLSGDEYKAGFYWGIASHYVDDVIIEPYLLQYKSGKLEAVWQYEEVATPINELVLSVPPDAVFPLKPVISIYPSPYDFLRGELLSARSRVAREQYKQAVAKTLSVLKTMYIAVTRGYYDSTAKREVLAHAIGFAGGLVAIMYGALEDKPDVSFTGTSMVSSGIPYIVYLKYRKLWESEK